MASLRTLDPRVAPFAQAFVRALSHFATVTITSARRDLADQQRIYARAQAGLSKYPAAKPGSSPHQIGIAFDLHLDPPIYEAAGRVWEAFGFRWGGRFSDADPIHFDFHPRGWVPGKPTPWGQPGNYGRRRRGST